MIKKVQLENFQSHKKTDIEFSEGLNVITGSSDVGKSALIRALLWVRDNRPLGEEFKRWGAKDGDNVRVLVEFDSGTVQKVRAKGKNRYAVDSHKFEAIKADVPREVSEALALADTNIQTQHQPYFLLQDSPGEVAKKLNEIAGLDVIDKLYSYFQTKITFCKSDILRNEARIKEAKDTIAKYHEVDDILELIKSIESCITEYKSMTKRMNDLYDCLDRIKGLEEEVENLSKIIPAQICIEHLRDDLAELDRMRNKIDEVLDIVDHISLVNEEIQRFEDHMKEMERKYKNTLIKSKVCPLSKVKFPKECLEKIQ